MNDESLNQKQPIPLELTAQQMVVVEALKSKETTKYPLSEWYLGALYVLNNYHNSDRVSQAAHSLRELLEKLPRVVRDMDDQGSLPDFKGMRRNLRERFSEDKKRYKREWKDKKIDDGLGKTLREVDNYLELSQQPTRKEQIQAAIAELDPMVDQLDSQILQIRQRKRDERHDLWKGLESFAHHNRSPNVEEFEEYLRTLERIILDHLAPATEQDQHEIQSILRLSEKSEDDVKRMLSLVERKGANFFFFFKRVTETADASWVDTLKNKGYFASPPKAERIDDNKTGFPLWWPILYLAEVSNHAPDKVTEIVLGLPKVDNPRVYESILDISLQLHGKQSAKLKPKILEYINIEYQFSAKRCADVMAHWVGEDQTSAALELLRTLVKFSPDHESQEKQARRGKPRPSFSDWEYKQILEKGVRPLSEREPYETAQVLIDATAAMIRLTLHQDELEGGSSNDYSTTWCWRVNKPFSNYQNSKESLVHALTFACETVYEKMPNSISELDRKLRDQRWDIFKRIRQHLYGLHPNKQTKPWIRELIFAYGNYDKWMYGPEFQRMVRLACKSKSLGADLLTKVEREKIFEDILSGPSEQDFQDKMGDSFTKEAFEKLKHYFHRMQLSPFSSVLFGEYANYFQELTAEEEEPITDDDYAPSESRVGRVEIRSPKPSEELAKMSDEELLSFLNDWEDVHRDPDDRSVHINFEGLVQEFQLAFKEFISPSKSRLKFWVENLDKIERPIYVRAMMSAINEQVELKKFDTLEQCFDLCEWVLSRLDQPEEEGVNHNDESRGYPDWRSSRRAVVDFIEVCLKGNIPISMRDRLASLLDKLCTQYDRGLDDDKSILLSRNDQLTTAINNTRSLGLKRLIDFSYWVRRQSENKQADVPEVFDILDKRLDSECEFPLTLPEYALLGVHYGPILDLNQKWAVQHKSDFFPQENLQVWTEAFENFLWYNEPYSLTFDIVRIIRDDIEFALENIDEFKAGNDGVVNPADKLENIDKFQVGNDRVIKLVDTLGQHLFDHYLRGFYPLRGDDSLLERFYKKTREDRECWSRLFSYIGHHALEKGFEERIKKFFNWRFEEEEPSELKEFKPWLEAECLDAEWRLTSFSKILDICKPGDIVISTEIDALQAMIEDYTALVVECFAKLTDYIVKVVKGGGTIYIPPDKAKLILRTGLDSDDVSVQANAKQAREKLLRCGYFDFLDE